MGVKIKTKMSGTHSPRSKRMSGSQHNPRLQDSPNHQKIVDITEKFKKITKEQEGDRKSKISIIDNNLNILEKEVSNTSAGETKFRVFRDELNSLQEKQNDERTQREWVEDKFSKDLRNCEENVRGIIDTDRLIRREYESKMMKGLEDKIFSLNVSHARVAKGMDEDFRRKGDEIKNFLGDLREGIEAETVQREEGIVL